MSTFLHVVCTSFMLYPLVNSMQYVNNSFHQCRIMFILSCQSLAVGTQHVFKCCSAECEASINRHRAECDTNRQISMELEKERGRLAGKTRVHGSMFLYANSALAVGSIIWEKQD